MIRTSLWRRLVTRPRFEVLMRPQRRTCLTALPSPSLTACFLYWTTCHRQAAFTTISPSRPFNRQTFPLTKMPTRGRMFPRLRLMRSRSTLASSSWFYFGFSRTCLALAFLDVLDVFHFFFPVEFFYIGRLYLNFSCLLFILFSRFTLSSVIDLHDFVDACLIFSIYYV